MTHLKLKSEKKGTHVHVRVFMGVDSDHLQLTGTLFMDVGQWKLFRAALGADGNLVVLPTEEA